MCKLERECVCVYVCRSLQVFKCALPKAFVKYFTLTRICTYAQCIFIDVYVV